VSSTNNYDSKAWATHLEKYAKDTQRVTPILAKQAKNKSKK